MKSWIGILVLMFVVGCAGGTAGTPRLRTPATRGGPSEPTSINSDAQCMDLIASQDRALFWAKILGGVGGAAAIGAVPDGWPDGAQWGIAAGAATASLAGAALVWYSEVKGARFKQYCEVEVPDGQ